MSSSIVYCIHVLQKKLENRLFDSLVSIYKRLCMLFYYLMLWPLLLCRWWIRIFVNSNSCWLYQLGFNFFLFLFEHSLACCVCMYARARALNMIFFAFFYIYFFYILSFYEISSWDPFGFRFCFVFILQHFEFADVVYVYVFTFFFCALSLLRSFVFYLFVVFHLIYNILFCFIGVFIRSTKLTQNISRKNRIMQIIDRES